MFKKYKKLTALFLLLLFAACLSGCDYIYRDWPVRNTIGALPEESISWLQTPEPDIELTSTPEPSIEPTQTPEPSIEPTPTPEPESTQQPVFTITYIYNNGNGNTVQNAVYGSLLAEPAEPVWKFRIFEGWYKDAAFEFAYDFSGGVTSDLCLYAKWLTDFAALTNEITASAMKANVTVKNRSYNTAWGGFQTDVTSCLGSGIIFQEDSNSYYALSNNHVTVTASGRDFQDLTVEDYLGNEYAAECINENAEYDLAVISFEKKSGTILNCLEIEESNLINGSEIAVLGQPKGQINALTYGTVNNYRKITLSDTEINQSNVTFNVMAHNAPIASGSSGGAVLSLNLKIAGIIYAGSTGSDGTFYEGFAIPAEKVREYLDYVNGLAESAA